MVRNNKQQPISIIVEDQFPVSTVKEIDVQDKKYENGTQVMLIYMIYNVDGRISPF